MTKLFEYLPPANEVWSKVILSVACVKNSVHSMPCRFPGQNQRESLRGQGVSRPTTRGGGSPGPHSGGGVLQAHTWGAGGSPGPLLEGLVYPSMQTPPPFWLTATASGGTHPTGIHSCFVNFISKKRMHSTVTRTPPPHHTPTPPLRPHTPDRDLPPPLEQTIASENIKTLPSRNFVCRR